LMAYWVVSANDMNSKKMISAIIIAKNEQSRIAQCLSKVDWADEVLVIDNGSADLTSSIAKKHGAVVIRENSDNFSQIRNTGAHHAKGEWLLYVDADEIVTDQLKKEILQVIKEESGCDAYFIPRQNYYLGKLWPTKDGMVRLVRSRSLQQWIGAVHEHAVIKGKTGRLKNFFIHTTHRSLEEMVAKTNEWSAIEATLRLRNGHPPVVWWRFLRVMMTGFTNSYIREEGWKAGTVGFIESSYQAFSMFITYAKLWEMQQKKIQ